MKKIITLVIFFCLCNITKAQIVKQDIYLEKHFNYIKVFTISDSICNVIKSNFMFNSYKTIVSKELNDYESSLYKEHVFVFTYKQWNQKLFYKILNIK